MVDDLDGFFALLSGFLLFSREDGLDVKIFPNLRPGSFVIGRLILVVETGLEKLRDGDPERVVGDLTLLRVEPPDGRMLLLGLGFRDIFLGNLMLLRPALRVEGVYVRLEPLDEWRLALDDLVVDGLRKTVGFEYVVLREGVFWMRIELPDDFRA